MKVFKFGGASVKDAKSVINVVEIIRLYKQDSLLVVISAMGKTTNALELVVDAIWNQQKSVFDQQISDIRSFHFSIIEQLFTSKLHPIYEKVNYVFDELVLQFNKKKSDNYHCEYDQVVSLGEVLSTLIVESYFQETSIQSIWVDARRIVCTNSNFRDADVNWKRTEKLIQNQVVPLFDEYQIVVTQGFIGHAPNSLTTTLGREGSDFTAGIFAYCMNAENVTIWKDVPGMLNADPKYFSDTVKLDQISFKEAIELAYYGASIIHPKTLKPLQNKTISLFVKSFVNPALEGTEIQQSTTQDKNIASFIFKVNQILILFRTRDFSFIVESHLSDIFNQLAALGVKINLMQNSALSFSILVDSEKVNMKEILACFQKDYEVKYNENLELVTVRHYDEATIKRVTEDKTILLEQYDRNTARIVMK